MDHLIKSYQPSPLLAPYVQEYWRAVFNPGAKAGYEQTVLPNGCIELIVHLGDEHCALKEGGTWENGPQNPLMGLYEKSYLVKFEQPVPVFGIRFYPDGIPNLFGIPPAEFLDAYGDTPDILGRELNTICDQIRELDDSQKQVALANRLLEKRLEKYRKQYDYGHEAMKWIRQNQGKNDFNGLVKYMPIGTRQLQREFRNNYGLGITDYMRLVRLNAIQRYMMAGQHSLTELSYELNFSDQSHFIREFRNYAGLAPGKFLKNREQFLVNIAN